MLLRPPVLRRLLLCGLLITVAWVSSTPLTGRGRVAASSRRPASEILVLSQGVNGYSGATDAWIDSLQPTTNYGNQAQMEVRGSGQADLLIRFDLTTLPPGIEIKAATLQLDVEERSSPDAIHVAAYRLRRPWSEDDVTWLLAANGAPWGGSGASDTAVDRFPVAADVVRLDQIGARYQWDVTEAAQDWHAVPAQNHGLILAAEEGAPASYTVYSAESTDLDLRPKLVVEYVTQPATATPAATLTPTSTSTPDLPTPAPSPTATSTPSPTLTPSPAATSTVTVTPTKPPSSLAVELALPAACDQGYEGDTRTWPAQVGTYTCRSTWPESGPEAIYKLSLNEPSDLSAQLVHDTTGVDLDLFLLTGSNPDTCMAGEDASVVRSQLEPGDYYLVVDGYQGSAGPFHLQITCGTRLGRISYLPIYIHSRNAVETQSLTPRTPLQP